MSDTYNGWANWETWNVALWMQNDEGIHRFMRGCNDYAEFIYAMRQCGCTETPDGVAWNDSGIDTDEIDAMIKEDASDRTWSMVRKNLR